MSDTARRAAPTSRRGVETRAALVRSARQVFERDGYLDARISDITAAARAATGSFYTYFDGKEAIFSAVLDELDEEMLHPRVEVAGEDGGDPVRVIEAANRAYLTAYRRNAGLMRVLEQVAHTNDTLNRRRQERSRAFLERNSRAIRRLQKQGLVDPDLDPRLAARALSGMMSQVAYAVFVLGERVPFEKLVATLNHLWINALGLKTET
jgi:AcrR family transcriptional regulator